MKGMIDDYSYGLGYESGFQEGRHQGYQEGAEEMSQQYEERVSKLHVEVETLRARVAVLERRTNAQG